MPVAVLAKAKLGSLQDLRVTVGTPHTLLSDLIITIERISNWL